MTTPNSQWLGKKGEAIAQHYLKKHNYHLKETNAKLGYYELDVVAQKGNITVFIEIKTRSIWPGSNPSIMLSRAQIKKLKKAIARYCHQHRLSFNYIRLDLIQLNYKNKNTIRITHYQDIL